MNLVIQLAKRQGIPASVRALFFALGLLTIGDGGSLQASYNYVADAPLSGQVTFARDNQTQLTTTRQYDGLNRLTNIVSTSGGNASPASAAYLYNLAQQRTNRTEADGSYWNYQYDALGQVTIGTRHAADGSLMPGQQFEFTYDDIGNRRETRTGGNAGGSNLRVSTYTPNLLNQVTQRTVPGFAELQGQANAAATVTVNVQPVERQGPFWRYEQGVNNSTGAVRQAMSIVAVLNGAGPDGKDIVSQGTASVFVAQSPETMTYDLAGRLVEDGQWDYQWDADSRLIRMQTLANAPESSQCRIFFSYDHLGRRTLKLTYRWVNGDWAWTETRQYLYDGWNLLAELDHNGNVVRTYGWGADLSGTLQGAGGVGGLVYVKQSDGTAAFPALDGNGNVTALYSATDGGELARYDHGPFGESLRASGPWAFANPFRFSTKYQDDETGLYYYGYRYYSPGTGRWLSRDPLGEEGGLNLYSAFFNAPTRYVDRDGLKNWSDPLAGQNGVNQVSFPASSLPRVASGWIPLANPDAELVEAVETTFWLIVPNPKHNWRSANSSFEASFDSDLPWDIRAAAASAGIGITILGTVELVPAAKALTIPLKKLACGSVKGVVFKTEEAIAAKDITALHKNANAYVGPQAVYEIRIGDEIWKYGKADASQIGGSGHPVRLQSQLNKFSTLNPEKQVTGRVLYQDAAISTKSIKEIETEYIQQYYNIYKKLPPGNQGHSWITR